MTKLHDSYQASHDIMRSRAVSFYGAFRLLPPERFRGVVALYAFCRYADDLVDDVTTPHQRAQALARIDALESAIQSLETETAVEVCESLVWWPAFVDTVRHWQIPLDPLLDQLEGQRSDLAFEDLETVSDLTRYGKLVAGSVGTMMLPLLTTEAAEHTQADYRLACERLGIAMQITNVLRDVGEDLRTRDRLYLPAELLTRYGVERTQLERLASLAEGAPVEVPEGFTRLWEHLAGLADHYYTDYLRWLHSFHRSCRLPLVAAQLTYQAIADAVRASGYNCFTRRNYTSKFERIRLVAEAKRIVRAYE